jgi:hypothetical protein
MKARLLMICTDYYILTLHEFLVIETRRENSGLREFLARLGYRVLMLDCWSPTCNYGFYLVK